MIPFVGLDVRRECYHTPRKNGKRGKPRTTRSNAENGETLEIVRFFACFQGFQNGARCGAASRRRAKIPAFFTALLRHDGTTIKRMLESDGWLRDEFADCQNSHDRKAWCERKISAIRIEGRRLQYELKNLMGFTYHDTSWIDANNAATAWGVALGDEKKEWDSYISAAIDSGCVLTDGEAAATSRNTAAEATAAHGAEKQATRGADASEALGDTIKAKTEKPLPRRKAGRPEGAGNGITQVEAAEQLGVSVSTIKKWERDPHCVPDNWRGYCPAVRRTEDSWNSWLMALGQKEGYHKTYSATAAIQSGLSIRRR